MKRILLASILLTPVSALAAVDSAPKRRAAMTQGSPGRVIPLPDGAVGAGDRGTLLGVYSFASLGGGGSPPATTLSAALINYICRRHRE